MSIFSKLSKILAFFALAFNISGLSSEAVADECSAGYICKNYGYDNPRMSGSITAVKCMLIKKSGKKTCHCVGLHDSLETPEDATFIMNMGSHYPNIIPELNQVGYDKQKYNIEGLSCPEESTRTPQIPGGEIKNPFPEDGQIESPADNLTQFEIIDF